MHIQNQIFTKVPTGIIGFDQITRGGLPRGRTTLLVGGPGSGKTIFALQFLLHGISHGEPAIFVAFEEAPHRITANFDNFGWDITSLHPDQLYFLDAQPSPDLIQSGPFDLSGMLAVLGAQAEAMGARRIVFDALDVVLTLLPDAAAARREVFRLHQWLLERELTGLITAKDGGGADSGVSIQQPFGLMQFMVECAVILNHRIEFGVSQRNLRVQKYRCSGFDENEFPFVIGSTGFNVAVARKLGNVDAPLVNERVTSGVERLDTMLGGGYYRGASVLITGLEGTAKTTLSCAFADAACKRGDRTLFVSFDSDSPEIMRNMTSVGIQLEPHSQSGMLCLISARTITGSAESLLAHIKNLANSHMARCVVIDPVSTLSKSGNELTAQGVARRLIDWTKAEGITLVCTSLLDEIDVHDMSTSLLISTLADTWIHLSYLVQAGERNRGLSVVKSRGTAHSNQVRELILTDDGVTLTDIYTAGGEVLMGTMRWEKESAERVANEVAEVAAQLDLVRLDAEEAVLEVRAKAVQTELLAKQVEKALLTRTREGREGELIKSLARMRMMRRADAAESGSKPAK